MKSYLNDDEEEFEKESRRLGKREIIVNICITMFMIIVFIVTFALCKASYDRSYQFGSSLWDQFYEEHNLEEP